MLKSKLQDAVRDGKPVILMISIQSLKGRFHFIKDHAIDLILIDEAHVGYAGGNDHNTHRALLLKLRAL